MSLIHTLTLPDIFELRIHSVFNSNNMTMRKFLIFIVTMTFSLFASGQKNEPDTVTITTNNYKLIRLKSGGQFGFGVAENYYGSKTKNWIGNHGSGVFAFQFFFGRHNIGGRFKPWTVNPEGNLVFGNDILTNLATMNVIKGEWFYGYDIEPIKQLLVEPYISYLSVSFPVINEDKIGKKYTIPSAHGLGFGVEVKRNCRVAPFQYLVPYLSINVAIIDFTKVNENLDKNFLSWEIGLKYGGWFTKKEVVK